MSEPTVRQYAKALAPIIASGLIGIVAIVGFAALVIGGGRAAPKAPKSPIAGLTKVSTNVSYGWVVTAGKFKGQTTDPVVVLSYPKKDRPPSEFKKLTCTVWANVTDAANLALASKAVQVCTSKTVSEAEVRASYTTGGGIPGGVPAA